MNGFIHRLGAAIRHRRAEGRRRQHAKRTSQHRGTIRQDVTEQIVRINHIKLFGRPNQLHRAIVGVHVGQFNFGVVRVHFGHDVTPQDTGFHDIGLFHRAQLLGPLHRHVERRTRATLNLGFGVALGVDAHAHVVFHVDATRFAKIDPRRQFAHDHDVEAGNEFFLQARKICQGVKTLGRSQISKQVHLFAQTQKTTFGFDRKIQIVIRRTTHSAEQHGVYLLRFGHRVIVQRCAMLVISCATNQIFGDIKMHVALGAEPVNDAADFCHDFLADTITWQDQKGGVRHGGHPKLITVDCA